MSFYVYSTLTNATTYNIFRPQPAESKSTPIVEHKITVNGGSNVMPLPQFGIITPRGVVTEVSDEDMALLEENYHFKEHKRLGFVTVDKKAKPVEKAIEAMEPKDASAPKTPDDFVPVEKAPGEAPAYKDKDSKRK